MFCSKCGSEITEGKKFCKQCGAPVEGAAAAPAPPVPSPPTPVAVPPPPPGVPPAPQAPIAAAPSAKGSGKAWLAVLLSLLGLAAVAGIVLVLVFLVFGGGEGPEDAAAKCIQAYGTGDYGKVSPYLDQSYFSGNKVLERAFEAGLEARIPEGGATYSDLEFEVSESGDEATVTLVGGKVEYEADGKGITYDLKETGSNVVLKMVKKDGKWLVVPSSFSETLAAGLINLGDKAVGDLEDADAALDDAFTELNDFIYSDPQPSGAQIKQELSGVESEVKSFSAQSEEAKAYYQEVLELKGNRLGPYQDYAEAVISLLDVYAELNDLEIEAYAYIAQAYSDEDAGQLVDYDAFNAAIDQFNAEKDAKLAEMEDLESQVYDLQMDLQLYVMGASDEE